MSILTEDLRVILVKYMSPVEGERQEAEKYLNESLSGVEERLEVCIGVITTAVDEDARVACMRLLGEGLFKGIHRAWYEVSDKTKLEARACVLGQLNADASQQMSLQVAWVITEMVNAMDAEGGWADFWDVLFGFLEMGNPMKAMQGLDLLQRIAHGYLSGKHPDMEKLRSLLKRLAGSEDEDVAIAALQTAAMFLQVHANGKEKKRFRVFLQDFVQILETSYRSRNTKKLEAILDILDNIALYVPRSLVPDIDDIWSCTIKIAGDHAQEPYTRLSAAQFMLHLAEAHDEVPGLIRRKEGFSVDFFLVLFDFITDYNGSASAGADPTTDSGASSTTKRPKTEAAPSVSGTGDGVKYSERPGSEGASSSRDVQSSTPVVPPMTPLTKVPRAAAQTPTLVEESLQPGITHPGWPSLPGQMTPIGARTPGMPAHSFTPVTPAGTTPPQVSGVLHRSPHATPKPKLSSPQDKATALREKMNMSEEQIGRTLRPRGAVMTYEATVAMGSYVFMGHAVDILPSAFRDADPRRRCAVFICLAQVVRGSVEVQDHHLDLLADLCTEGLRDSDTGVQEAARQALYEMCWKFGGNFRATQPAVLVPVILELMQDGSRPHAQTEACRIVAYLFRRCEQGIVEGYMDELLAQLLQLLQQSHQVVQGEAILAVAHIAKGCREPFVDYRDKVLSLLANILDNAKEARDWELWGKAVDGISMIVKALGRDLCHTEAVALLLHIELVQDGQTTSTDLVDHPIMRATARISTCLRMEFLPHVWRFWMYAIRISELRDTEVSQIEAEPEEAWNGFRFGNNKFVLDEGVLEKKAAACRTIGKLARDLGIAFIPYLDKVVSVVTPLMKTHRHEGLRQQAIRCMGHLLRCTCLAADIGRPGVADLELVQRVLKRTWEPLLDAIAKDNGWMTWVVQETNYRCMLTLLEIVTEVIDMRVQYDLGPVDADMVLVRIHAVLDDVHTRGCTRYVKKADGSCDDNMAKDFKVMQAREVPLIQRVEACLAALQAGHYLCDSRKEEVYLHLSEVNGNDTGPVDYMGSDYDSDDAIVDESMQWEYDNSDPKEFLEIGMPG